MKPANMPGRKHARRVSALERMSRPFRAQREDESDKDYGHSVEAHKLALARTKHNIAAVSDASSIRTKKNRANLMKAR